MLKLELIEQVKVQVCTLVTTVGGGENSGGGIHGGVDGSGLWR